MQPSVYILASRPNGTLYVGVTNNLKRRVWEHKNKLADSFTKKYDVTLLVYYEAHQYMIDAIIREKHIKHWKREWKIELIEKNNSSWSDLYENL